MTMHVHKYMHAKMYLYYGLCSCSATEQLFTNLCACLNLNYMINMVICLIFYHVQFFRFSCLRSDFVILDTLIIFTYLLT